MIKLEKKTAFKFILALILLVGGFLFVQTVFAQDFGTDVVGENIALADAGDPRVVAAKIIRIALGFLGIIAVCIVLYGGFMWMTSAGNEERLGKAKKILTSGLIGLIIILMAFGITQFVLSKLSEATGIDGGGGDGGGGGGGGGLPSDAFLVRSIQPNGDIPIRNVVVRILFNRNVNEESLKAVGNFTVRRTTDDALVEGTITVLGNLVEFVPNAACPEPNEDRKCFDADTKFLVGLTAGVRSVTGKSLMCGGLAPSCSVTFTTGNLVDVMGPKVNISYPKNKQTVCVDKIDERIEAYAKDDAGISYLDYFTNGTFLDRDAPEGPTVPEYFSAINWDTTGILKGSKYKLNATAFDIDSNNTVSDGVDVIMRAEHCCNGVKDVPDEEDIDCGGADCGKCDDDACVDDIECRSGTCLDGVCRSLPRIMGVLPNDGAPGNYITIIGEHFGTEVGSVYFSNDVRADFPSACPKAASWQDRQIIVEVPEGAVDGPIRIVAVSPAEGRVEDYTDRTDDDIRGRKLPDFNVNEMRRPGICSVINSVSGEPTGEPKEEVRVSGTQFGEQQDDGQVIFGGTRAERILDWGESSIGATVPLIAPTTVPVQVTKGEENSNPVNFTVIRSAATPNILSFSPVAGPEDEYITILGSNFGNDPGIVELRAPAPDGTIIRVIPNFPEECGNDWWKNDTVVIKIPREARVELPGPKYILNLITHEGLSDDTSDLTPSTLEVTRGVAKPGICRISPVSGPERIAVTVYGKRFGERMGTLNFWREKVALVEDEDWGDEKIVGQVPAEAETGPVNVLVGEKRSNEINFIVKDCSDRGTPCSEGEECCRDGSCAGAESGGCMVAPGSGHYFWRFSTGEIPINPVVIEYCGPAGEVGGLNPSPTPWIRREGGNNVCVNAQISVRFNVKMSNDSLIAPDNNIIVEECDNDTDNDGVADDADNCPAIPNPAQADVDRDDIGDACDNVDPCAVIEREVVGTVEPFDADGALLGDGFDAFNFVLPPGAPHFNRNKYYKVTLKGGSAVAPGLRSVAGLLLDGDKNGEEGGDYVFKFKTRDTDELCHIGSIGIMPPTKTLTEKWVAAVPLSENSQQTYNGLCYAEGDVCLTLACGSYVWDWRSSDTLDPKISLLEVRDAEGGVIGPKRLARAVEETDMVIDPMTHLPRPVPVIITGAIPAERKSGTGSLTINFTDPKVIEKWPDCREACKNSEIGVKFNTWMDEARARDLRNIKLYIWRCGNSVIDPGEDCDDGNLIPNDGCSIACLNEGTPICADFDLERREVSALENCCGNGRRDPGEDCDGNPFPAHCLVGVDGERGNCLNIGRPGIDIVGGVCGNGTIEEGEDCDPPDLEPLPGSSGCSAACLNQGTAGLSPAPGGIDAVHPVYSSIDTGAGRWEHKLIFDFPLGFTFFSNTWYRAVISDAQRSASGVPLTELNYDDRADVPGVDSYSWTFRTKSDDSVCAVDRTEISPKEARVKVVGATADFRSMPFGVPDECSPSGQRLRAMDYPWTWSSSAEEVGILPRPHLDDIFPGCGNNVIEFGEDCDDGNILSGDGCAGGRECVNEGEDACGYLVAAGCNFDRRCGWVEVDGAGRCVKKTVCGNRVVEIGEDCDDGNTRSGDGCNNKCLNEGSVAGGSRCGDMSLGAGEDCDDGNTRSGDGCSNLCLNEGTVLDGWADPIQTVTAVGLREDHTTEDTTEISAWTTDGEHGLGNFTLACGYSLPGNPCPDEEINGIGRNSCCYPKPKVETCNPSGAAICSPRGSEEDDRVCRNSLISIIFSQAMNQDSIEGNIIVAGNYAVCPEGTTDIGDGDPLDELDKWCAITGETVVNQIITEDAEDEEIKTKVDFNLLNLLDSNVKYKVIVKGNNLATLDRVEGVRSINGVELGEAPFIFNENDAAYQSRAWTFWTSDEICALDSVEIDPSQKLFTSSLAPEDRENFIATARDRRGDPISPVAEYAWGWDWASSHTDIATLGECAVESGNCQNVMAQNKNGETLISVTAKIIVDSVMETSTVGQTKTAVSNVIVFLCENPWPDAETIEDGGFLDETYNFKFYYCRDKGEFDVGDDLPAFPLSVERIEPPEGVDDMLGEYLLTFQDAHYCSVSQTLCVFGALPDALDSCPVGMGDCRRAEDAIGFRIYENADHLTPTEWYQKQGLIAGSPETINIDGYEAIRDGRTVYVSAANDIDSDIFTNIYLVSYNEGANSDTINIYNQILQNLRFNTNLEDEDLRVCLYSACSNNANKYCIVDGDCRSIANTTSICLPKASCTKDIDCPPAVPVGSLAGTINECQVPKDKLARDVRRIIDLNNIKKAIDSYKTIHGTYPKLEAGTYIRSLVASVWGSWSGQFGSDLGTALPVDPINKMVGCGGEAGFNEETCWNLTSKQYQCPVGSHIYQYEVSRGAYKLKSDFEYTADAAVGSLRTLWENALSNTFEIQGTCNGGVISSTGVCGDRIINIDSGEQCEVGMAKSCSESSPNIVMRGRGCANDNDCNATPPVAGSGWCLEREIGCTMRTCQRKTCSVTVASTCANNADCPAGESCVVREERSITGDTCPPSLPMEKADSEREGRQRYECNPADCTWRTVGGCSVLCGNGVKDGTEECDEGPLGGRIAGGGMSSTNQYFCTRNCIMTDGYCGNSVLEPAYGERCDDGYCSLGYECTAAWCWCSVPGIDHLCKVPEGQISCGNGTYGRDILNYDIFVDPQCKTDCSGFGPYCGDEVVNGAEECDGNAITSRGVCVSASAGEAPDSADNIPCENDEDCDGDDTCSLCPNTGEGYAQLRTKNCKPSPLPPPDGTDYTVALRVSIDNECKWDRWGACEPAGTCGNGVKEGIEECDDGNTNNTDGCIIIASGPPGLNNCKTARCGDGFTKTGTEACDVGIDNGRICTASYGETCNYCNVNCAIKVITGPRCGDGIKNARDGETCDDREGTELTWTKFDAVNKFFTEGRGLASLGIQVPSVMNCPVDPRRASVSCGTAEAPRDCEAGTCLAQPTTGGVCSITIAQACTTNADCPLIGAGPQRETCGLAWNRAMCSADCTSTCPPSYRVQTLTFGPEGRSSIELASGVGTTVNLPSCRLLGDLKVDVDLSDVEQTPLNVVFVTDRSGSMIWGDTDESVANLTCGGISGRSRMDCAKSSLVSAIDLLIDSYENIHIGLVEYATDASSSLPSPYFLGWTGRSLLESIVSSYTPYIIGTPESATNIAAGIKKASDILADQMGKKIIILMSDGVATRPIVTEEGVAVCLSYDGDDYAACVAREEATTAKRDGGIEIYTILFYGPTDAERNMQLMASSSATGQHAYTSNSTTDLNAIYRSIIDALTASTVRLGGALTIGGVATTGGIRGGADIPISRNIECQDREQRDIPFSIEFEGTGSARVSNLRAYTCAGPPWPPDE